MQARPKPSKNTQYSVDTRAEWCTEDSDKNDLSMFFQGNMSSVFGAGSSASLGPLCTADSQHSFILCGWLVHTL